MPGYQGFICVHIQDVSHQFPGWTKTCYAQVSLSDNLDWSEPLYQVISMLAVFQQAACQWAHAPCNKYIQLIRHSGIKKCLSGWKLIKAIFPAPTPPFLKSRTQFRLINRDILPRSTNGLSLTAYILYRKNISQIKRLPRVLLRELSYYPGKTSKHHRLETFSLIKRKLVNKRTQHKHIQFDFEKIPVLLKTCVCLRLKSPPGPVQTHILKCKLGVKVEPGTVALHWRTGTWAGHFRYTSDTRNP